MFLIVAFGLIFFRAANMHDAYLVMKNMFVFNGSLINIFLGISPLKLFLLFSTLTLVFIIERVNELKPTYFRNLFSKKYIQQYT